MRLPWPDAKKLVDKINSDWKLLYDTECLQSGKNRWCGPAYLAAIVDVMARWQRELGAANHFVTAFNYLKTLEIWASDTATAGFQATAPQEDMNIWTTGLVLRTLSTVPESQESLVDRAQLQRVALWLLDHLATGKWTANGGEAPMLLARSLHGLRRVRTWVDGPTRDLIDVEVERGNKKLADFFAFGQPVHKRIGNLKAYTAVAEYLADWMLRVPAGLIFDAAKGLGSSSVIRAEPEIVQGGLRVAWLSDLHVAANDEREGGKFSLLQQYAGRFMHLKGTPLTKYFQARNVRTILQRVQELQFDHILVTGDLTNYATEAQFQSVRDEFLKIQAAIPRSDGVSRPATLDPELWTILPGNHDVTTDKQNDSPTRYNLGLFLSFFAESYSQSNRGGGDEIFPLQKNLRGRKSVFNIRLLGLDSTVPQPVWRVGVNARGRIDRVQLDKLAEILNAQTDATMTLVAIHHHPIVVPEMTSAAEDFFLSLNEADGRKFIQLCASSGVRGILHGHFHRYSTWSGLTPEGKYMTAIGSAAGSLIPPHTGEEFLELREADVETPDGVQRGLGLYAHRLQQSNWVQQFTGIFLPCRF